MSFGPAFDAKEQVRQAVDIVDLVGSYLQLRRQGRNFVGLCPWHDDSRPSLQVNPERQSFKCWVCDVGGDVFSFVMKAEGLEFREALEMLAERAGISLRAAAVKQAASRAVARRPDPRTTSARCTASMAWAEEQFHRCLIAAPEAEAGAAISGRARHHRRKRPPLPPGLCARPLGLAAGASPRHASGRRPFSSASACCAARSWAAAFTIGSAAA